MQLDKYRVTELQGFVIAYTTLQVATCDVLTESPLVSFIFYICSKMKFDIFFVVSFDYINDVLYCHYNGADEEI